MPDDDERPREPVPPYLRIAADLEKDIRSGRLAPGAPVPSLNRLAQEYGVARNTVVRALNVLKEKELITSQQGWGNFVTDPVPREQLSVQGHRMRSQRAGALCPVSEAVPLAEVMRCGMISLDRFTLLPGPLVEVFSVIPHQ